MKKTASFYLIWILACTLSVFAGNEAIPSIQRGIPLPDPRLRAQWSVNGSVKSLCATRDGKRLFVGDTEGKITIFDVVSGEKVQTIQSGGSIIFKLHITANGNLVGIYGGGQVALALWDMQTGQKLWTIVLDSSIRDLSSTPDSKNVMFVYKHNLCVIDALNGSKKNLPLPTDNESISEEIFCLPDSRHVLLASTGFIDIQSGAIKARLKSTRGSESLSTTAGVRTIFGDYFKTTFELPLDRIVEILHSSTGKTPPEIYTKFTHCGAIIGRYERPLGMSLDGRMLAYVLDENHVVLTDFSSGRVLKELGDQPGQIQALTFSPDNSLLYAGGHDRQVSVWDLSKAVEAPARESWSAKPLWFIPTFSASKDGNRIFTADEDGGIHVFDRQRGQELAYYWRKGDEQQNNLLANDRIQALFGNEKGFYLIDESCQLVDLKAVISTPVRLMTGDRNSPMVRVQRDGQRILFAYPDPPLEMEPEPAKELTQEEIMQRMKMPPKRSSSLKLLDASLAPAAVAFTEHMGTGIQRACFSPSGKWIASLGKDGKIRLFETLSGKCVGTMAAHLGKPIGIVANDDGLVVLSTEEGSLEAYRPADGTVLTTREDADFSGFSSLAISPDGKWIAGGTKRFLIKLWRLPELTCVGGIETIPGDSQIGLRAIEFLNDQTVAVNGGDSIKTFNLKEAIDLAKWIVFESHGDIKALAISADCSLIAVGDSHGIITILDAETHRPTIQLNGHQQGISRIAFIGNSKRFASTGGDGAFKLWDLDKSKKPEILLDASNPTYKLATSPDGRYAAFAGQAPWGRPKAEPLEVKIWDLEKKQKIHAIPITTDDWLKGICFSRDGTRLAITLPEMNSQVEDVPNSKTFIFDLKTGKILPKPPDPVEMFRGFDLPQDGRFLALPVTYELRTWNLSQPHPAMRAIHQSDANAAIYIPDHSWIALSHRRRLSIFSLSDGKKIWTFPQGGSSIMVYDAKRQRILCSSSGMVKQYYLPPP